MRLQLGALVASGHSPDAILGWTWRQIEEASQAVRLYHSDLAASLMSGKSPVATAARRWATQQQARKVLTEQIRKNRPELDPVDAAKVAHDEVNLQTLRRLGVVIRETRTSEVGDLFQLARDLKASGAGGGPGPQGSQDS